MRVLFLYTELADYTMACLRALKKEAPHADLKVVHFPVNKEAPFSFSFDDVGEFTCINDFPDFDSFYKYSLQFKPDRIVCSGWTNRWYLRVCRKLRQQATTILCSDNLWLNTPRQRVLAMTSGFTIRRIFDKIWVPGLPQMEFARKLGYSGEKVLQGFYSCDVNRFSAYYQKYSEEKQRHFPHRFLCVARYIPVKGYDNLWKAFKKWKAMHESDWQLWCAGTGEGFESRVRHPAIKHLGFIQKHEWDEVVRQTGVFVLASRYEPWGVAVHEFACAGYPLLLSKAIGSSSAFLNKQNGLAFDPMNIDQLVNCFDQIAKKPDNELLEMSRLSFEASQVITPQSWARTLLHS